MLVGFERHLHFLDIVSKDTHIRNFMKIRPVGAQLFVRRDVETDRHEEGNIRFSKFYERS
jgi:hypothetical protein